MATKMRKKPDTKPVEEAAAQMGIDAQGSAPAAVIDKDEDGKLEAGLHIISTGPGEVVAVAVRDADEDGHADVASATIGVGGQEVVNVQARDLDDNGVMDLITKQVDRDGDGKADTEITEVNRDDKGAPEVVVTAEDTTGDGNTDKITAEVDRNNDGNPEAVRVVQDTDGDGHPDEVLATVDTDGDGNFDKLDEGQDRDGDGLADVGRTFQDVTTGLGTIGQDLAGPSEDTDKAAKDAAKAVSLTMADPAGMAEMGDGPDLPKGKNGAALKFNDVEKRRGSSDQEGANTGTKTARAGLQKWQRNAARSKSGKAGIASRGKGKGMPAEIKRFKKAAKGKGKGR